MRDVVDTRELDADKDRAWNGRFGFHDAALAGSFLCSARAYHVFAMAQAAKPPMYRQEDGGRLRGFADRGHFAPPRRNGAAAVMNCARLNDKAAPFQRKAKGFSGRGFLGVNPYDQDTGGAQELEQPVKRDLKRLEGASSPIDQRYVVLARRMAAICRGCRAGIAAALKL